MFFASLSDRSKKKKVVIDAAPKPTDDKPAQAKPIFSDRLCPAKLHRRRSPTRSIISLIWLSFHSRDICTSLLLNVGCEPAPSHDCHYANGPTSRSSAMADSSESQPVLRSTKPVSEALLNEKVLSRFHDFLSVVAVRLAPTARGRLLQESDSDAGRLHAIPAPVLI